MDESVSQLIALQSQLIIHSPITTPVPKTALNHNLLTNHHENYIYRDIYGGFKLMSIIFLFLSNDSGIESFIR